MSPHTASYQKLGNAAPANDIVYRQGAPEDRLGDIRVEDLCERPICRRHKCHAKHE